MYYKSNIREYCQNYDDLVTASENYPLNDNWANPIEIDGKWYILKHEDYDSEMQLVNELPSQDLNLE